MRHLKLGIISAGLLGLAACDYSGLFLFPELVEDVDAVQHLGLFEPVDVESTADIEAAAVYGQVSSTGTSDSGGVTWAFEGTGGDVCVFVDPEFITWNTSVAARGGTRRWRYPDNITDDGDLDLEVGQAIYYNGTPGEAIGDFAIRYEDALGNPVAIELNECVIPQPRIGLASGGSSGRGAPEYCTIENTQPGVTYIVKMETWSTPIDDDRLGFGFLIVNGTCGGMFQDVIIETDDTGPNIADQSAEYECVIRGESLDWEAAAATAEGSMGPWFGLSSVESLTRAGARDFEQSFCAADRLNDICETEAAEKDCVGEPYSCFCGDPSDLPSAGSF